MSKVGVVYRGNILGTGLAQVEGSNFSGGIGGTDMVNSAKIVVATEDTRSDVGDHGF